MMTHYICLFVRISLSLHPLPCLYLPHPSASSYTADFGALPKYLTKLKFRRVLPPKVKKKPSKLLPSSLTNLSMRHCVRSGFQKEATDSSPTSPCKLLTHSGHQH